MKPLSFAPPILALIVVGVWVGAKRASFASVAHESALLRGQIARASSRGVGSDASAKQLSPHAPPDWKKIGARIVESQAGRGGMADLRGEIRLAQRLERMSAAEILAAFDEIDSLNLPASSRDALEQQLFDKLAKEDPGAAIERFADRIGTRGNLSGELSRTFRTWAQKDLSRATDIKLSPSEIASFAQALSGTLGYMQLDVSRGRWIEWAGANVPSDKRNLLVHNLMYDWTIDDFQAVGEWLNTVVDGPIKHSAIRTYAATLAPYQPEAAAEWAVTLPPNAGRQSILKQIHSKWPQTDPAAKAAAAAFAIKHGIK